MPYNREVNLRWRHNNVEKIKAYDKAMRQKIRLEFLVAYGHKCVCCGEPREAFLSLEHVKRDGALHRKKVGSGGVYKDLRRRGWPKGDYTILCYNCNNATKAGKRCPHQMSTEPIE